MKKFLLGLCLMLCGAISFAGVIVAGCVTGGWDILDCLDCFGDWILFLASLGVFVAGLVIALREIKKDNG